MRRLLFAALGAAAFIALSCGKGSVPAGRQGTPVFLISIDTLRSDHLPAYGYNGVETPHIDSLRDDGILYERAFSHCPLTLPSHSTVLTGLLPADNGVRDNTGFQFGDKLQTLPAVMKANGYSTGAAVSAFVLRKETGINRGFDEYDDQVESVGGAATMGRIQRPGNETVGVAEKFISAHEKNPLFYFMHLYEPHTPYEPPEPYKSKYSLPYDGEIAAADQYVGDFIDFLKKNDLYDQSLIILFSDHGEGLHEHGEEEHGMFVYRETLQVPLIVKLPKQKLAGTHVAAPVQLVDIFPTIIDQTKAKADTTHLAGRSLLASINDDKPRMIYSETYYPRFHFGWSDLHSLTDGTNHLISAPKPELYDMVADKGETHNVLQDNRRVYVAMRKAIEPFMKEAAAPSAIDPEAAAKLAALGYVGSTVQTAPGEALPDPKDKIGDFKDIQKAFSLNMHGNYQEALALTTKLLADNPRMTDLWAVKAKALQRLGRFDQAVEAVKEAFRLSPTSFNYALEIANIYLQLDKLDEAQQHAELALKGDPGQAHEVLARVWLKRKNLANAEKEARIAMTYKKQKAPAFMILGNIAKERGQLPEALQFFDQAKATVTDKQRSMLMLNFQRGDVLARMGRNAEAEAAFNEEIKLYPDNVQTYKNLVLLYMSDGRYDDATRVIRECVANSPLPPSYLAVAETLRVIGDARGARYWAREGLRRFPGDPSLSKFAATL